MALDPIAELEALIDAFDADGVEYALCGGLALAVHGHPRATQDIDILVESSQLTSAVATAKRIGLRTTLDVSVVNAELAEVWADRQRFRSGARQIVVVSRSGLATMKRIAGRQQDLADVAKLEGTDEDDDQ